MDLADALQTAIEARLAPRVDLARRVRSALDHLLDAERAAVTVEVTNRLLLTLGAEADKAGAGASEAVAPALDELKKAVAALAPEPIGAPARRAATPSEIARAESLIQEIATVDTGMHHGRLTPLLRALAAETRALMEPLSPGDPCFRELFAQLEAIMRLRKTADLKQFVNGLNPSQSADWAQAAFEARREVARIDGSKSNFRVVGG